MSDRGINFKITASAQLQALRETERQLIAQVTAAKAAGASLNQLEGDLRKLANVQAEMKGMGFVGRLKAGALEAGEAVEAEVNGEDGKNNPHGGKVSVTGEAVTVNDGKDIEGDRRENQGAEESDKRHEDETTLGAASPHLVEPGQKEVHSGVEASHERNMT